MPLAPTKKWTDGLSWGVVPRNKEQGFAYDLLFDDDIPLVSLIGKAGSGKTLMAIAAGMEQTLGSNRVMDMSTPKYKKKLLCLDQSNLSERTLDSCPEP